MANSKRINKTESGRDGWSSRFNAETNGYGQSQLLGREAGLLNVVFLETRYNRGVIPKRPSSRDRSLINVILNENEWTIRCCERKQVNELDPIIEMEHRIKWDLKRKKPRKEETMI